MAKSLLVYYSRSGNAEKVAQQLRRRFGANVDKLVYGEEKKVGYLSACIEALSKKTTEITGDTHHPAKYEHVVFITPVWAGRMSTPVRTYAKKFQTSIKSYSVIATSGGSGIDGVLKEFKDLLGKDPVNTQVIHDKDIKAGKFTVEMLGK